MNFLVHSFCAALVLLNYALFCVQLTLCETVGYGDQINKEDSFKSIVDYIDNQFEAYLQEELKIKRNLAR